MDEFDWPDSNDDELRPISELTPFKRREFIEKVVREQLPTDAEDPTAHQGTLRYRMLRAIAEAAFDYAAPLGTTVTSFEEDFLWNGFGLESELRCALTIYVQHDPPLGDNYWVHNDNMVRQVKEGHEVTIYRDGVEQVAAGYLALPYRIPEFERLLVDVLIATEMYAYYSEAFGKRAKPFLGFISPLSLLKPHPLWQYAKAIFYELLFVALMVGIVSFALSFWSAQAVGWVVVVGIILFVVSVVVSTVLLPFTWRRHSEYMKQGRELIKHMSMTYFELSGTGVASTLRVREVASKAADAGVVWPAPLFAILDDNIQRSGQLAAPQF